MKTLTASEVAKKLHAKRNGQNALHHMAVVAQITQATSRIKKAAKDPERNIAIPPTPERLAKGDIDPRGQIVRGEGRRYKTKPPVEHYSGQWPSNVEAAFTCFVFDSEAGEYGRVTINYGGTGGGVPGSHLGGLGNAQDRARDAHERYCWVRDRLSGEAREVLDVLVLQLRADTQGTNLESFGQRLFPSIRDKATRRGISIGALLLAGDQLAMLYRKYSVIAYQPARRQMKVVGA